MQDPASRQRLPTQRERLSRFLKEASVLERTEEGSDVKGLIFPTHPWIYFDSAANEMACERCYQVEHRDEYSTLDPLVLLAFNFFPFANAHKACAKKENA